jgi:hypothetical protein
VFSSLGVVLFYLAVTYTVGTAGSDIPFKLLCFMSKGFVLKIYSEGSYRTPQSLKKKQRTNVHLQKHVRETSCVILEMKDADRH